MRTTLALLLLCAACGAQELAFQMLPNATEVNTSVLLYSPGSGIFNDPLVTLNGLPLPVLEYDCSGHWARVMIPEGARTGRIEVGEVQSYGFLYVVGESILWGAQANGTVWTGESVTVVGSSQEPPVTMTFSVPDGYRVSVDVVMLGVDTWYPVVNLVPWVALEVELGWLGMSNVVGGWCNGWLWGPPQGGLYEFTCAPVQLPIPTPMYYIMTLRLVPVD